MHFFTAPGLIVFLAVAAMLGVAHSLRADELAEAGKLLSAGQHQRAQERVAAALASNPDDPRARFLQGLIYAERGNAAAAIDVFQKLTVDFPELPEPHNNLAVIYASRGEYDKARTALEQSIRTHPSYATAYENLGDVYAKLASQAYDRALKLDSTNAEAKNKLALVRDLVGSAAPTRAPGAPQVEAAPVVPAVRDVPAAPAPAPTPVASIARPAGPPQTDPEAVLQAVDAWAQAWSRQDVEAYLAAYHDDFRASGGQSRAAWEKHRRERVSAPKGIAVRIDEPRVLGGGDGEVRVTFLQHYRSDRFQASSHKTLRMRRSSDGRWRIAEESIGR
jgi:tetratricopeptide (TPR) repeat protein